MRVEHTDYTIVPARHAKQQFVIQPKSDGTGWKTRAARLAEAVGGRWCNRSGGYHVSKTRAERFVRLYAEGWDATSLRNHLIPPPEGETNAAS